MQIKRVRPVQAAVDDGGISPSGRWGMFWLAAASVKSTFGPTKPFSQKRHKPLLCNGLQVHPAGFDATRENTGENVFLGSGGNAGGNGANDPLEIAAQMQRAWDRLDEGARIDLLAVAKGLIKRQGAKPKRS